MDEDSVVKELIFYVVGSKGGFPALKKQPDVALRNFTQNQINQSEIVFAHDGEWIDLFFCICILYTCSLETGTKNALLKQELLLDNELVGNPNFHYYKLQVFPYALF